jgi:secreted PhoX family phosphatase
VLRRRTLLGAVGGAGVASLLAALGPRRAHAAPLYGELVPDPDGLLDLPPGFKYRVLERWKDAMDDGYVVPGLPDGMGCFPGPDGTIVLVRNHELVVGDGPYAAGSAPDAAYDPLAMGCCTRVVLDAATFERRSSNLVLCGTLKNCAGGVSPWGWLTCEETTNAGHGYVFAVDPHASVVQPPLKIAAYGRCKHEAACVDPATNTAYLTEDQTDSAFYRFVPTAKDDPFVGRLQALRIVGHDAYEMSNLIQGDRLSIAWVDLDEPEPTGDTLRVEAQAKGAAIFDRGEGIAFADGAVYIIATSGGPLRKGQIFRLEDTPSGGTIEAILVVDDTEVADQPDNICVAPWGELFFGEDGGGGNYIRGVTPDGQVFTFAHNALTTGEIAGVCFSPDGRALFANFWGSGITFVITGPFPTPLPDDEDTDTDTAADDTTGATDDTTGEAPTSGLESSGADLDASSDPPEIGGAFEEPSACECRADADAPSATTLAAIVAAVALTAPKPRPAD